MTAEQISKLLEEVNAALKEATPEDAESVRRFYDQTLEAIKRKAGTNEKFKSIAQV